MQDVLADKLAGTNRSFFAWIKSEATPVTPVMFGINTATGGNISHFELKWKYIRTNIMVLLAMQGIGTIYTW